MALVKAGFNSMSGGGNLTEQVQLTGVQAGDAIKIWVKHEGPAVSIDVSDGTSSFTPKTKRSHTNGDLHGQWFYLLVSVATGTVTYTVTFGAASASFVRLHVIRYTYTGTASFGTEATNEGTGTVVSSGNMNTTGADEAVSAGYGEYSGETPSNPQVNGVAATGSNLDSPAGSFTSSWHRILTSTFSGGAATLALSGSADWICCALAIKTDQGGGSGAEIRSTFADTRAAQAAQEEAADAHMFGARVFRPRAGVSQPAGTPARPRVNAQRTVFENPEGTWDYANTVALHSPSPGFATGPTPRIFMSTAAAIAAEEERRELHLFRARLFRPATGVQPATFTAPRRTFGYSSATIEADAEIANFLSLFGARITRGRAGGTALATPRRTFSSPLAAFEAEQALAEFISYYGVRLSKGQRGSATLYVLMRNWRDLTPAVIARDITPNVIVRELR